MPPATHVPPQNIEAEESVLGAMLVTAPTLTRVIDEVKLRTEDFYGDRHRAIFEAVHDLYADSKPVDELSVSEYLTQHDKIDQAGGKHYISELAAKVPAAGNAFYYAEIVQRNSELRRLEGHGQRTVELIRNRNGSTPAELFERVRADLEGSDLGDATAALGTPKEVLTASRVDLVERIREGIPDRQFVPGTNYLLAGKRYLAPAPAGTGKSMAITVVGVDVVEAGGTVAIFDVENGADEYARRLADVLAARDDTDGTLAIACSERLRYFEWPALKMTWGPEWAEVLAGVDLAVFDSSRMILSAAGLAEDQNDDYAAFVNALLIPLAREGVATIVLDNTGHDAKDRARGASAKADLNEVVYLVKVGQEFDRDQTGHLRLVLRRTRFSDLPGELHIPIGGGIYGPVVEAEPEADSDGFRPTALMERCSLAVESNPGLNRKEILALVGGKKEYSSMALTLLVTEEYVRSEPDGREKRHHSEKPYREVDDAS